MRSFPSGCADCTTSTAPVVSLESYRDSRGADSARFCQLREAVAILDGMRSAIARLSVVVSDMQAADGVPVRATRATVGAWLADLRAPVTDHPRARELPRLLDLARAHIERLPFSGDAPTPAFAGDARWEEWAARKGCADVVLSELGTEAATIAADLGAELDAADARRRATSERVRAELRRQRARRVLAAAAEAKGTFRLAPLGDVAG